MVRLDGFLVTDDWDSSLGGARPSLLPRPTSDHFPVLLEGGGCLARGPSSFRFKNMWLKAERFKNLMSDWWQSIEVRGSGSYMLEKSKALKAKLRIWNREVFGKVEERKRLALVKVAYWDAVETQRLLSLKEMEEKVVALEDFKLWALLEETLWRQKSREIWLKEGDRNTRLLNKWCMGLN